MSIDEQQDIKDFEALSNMVEQSNKQDLLIEVLWTFANRDISTPIPERCMSALFEWDC